MKTLKGHLFFLFLLVCKILYSQEINIDTIPPRPMNSFNLNLGDASGISLSYERLFKIGENFLLAGRIGLGFNEEYRPVSYTHLRAHETVLDLVCRLLLEKKKNTHTNTHTQHNTHTHNYTTYALVTV